MPTYPAFFRVNCAFFRVICAFFRVQSTVCREVLLAQYRNVP